MFARPEHPLVLFLDDLQWLDPATLKFLTHVISPPKTGHLLVIGAYRDNEVGPQHQGMLRSCKHIEEVLQDSEKAILGLVRR